MKKLFYYTLSALFILSCNKSDNFKEAYNSINQKEIKTRIKTLASDDFMGRMQFTEGETITINYIADQFKKMGLEPGNNGSYFQEAPMVEIIANVDSTMYITGGENTIELNFWDDFVALTRQVTDAIEIDHSELVFAGYGIVAPEYDWIDYEGLDLKGKTAVVLVNDPGFGKIGIPALYGKGGFDSAKNGKEWGKEQVDIYIAQHYHKPSDEYAEDFDAEGIVLDSQVYFEVGYTLANESTFPKWKKGSEFKAIREGK